MLSETEMLDIIKAKVLASSQAIVARELGISRAYMSDIVRGRRTISDVVAKRFGYKLHLVYERRYTEN